MGINKRTGNDYGITLATMKFVTTALSLAAVAVAKPAHHIEDDTRHIKSGAILNNPEEYDEYKAAKVAASRGGVVGLTFMPSLARIPGSQIVGENGHGQQQHFLGENGHGIQQHHMGENGHGIQPHHTGENGHGIQPHHMGENGHGIWNASIVSMKNGIHHKQNIRQEEFGVNPQDSNPHMRRLHQEELNLFSTWDYENPIGSNNRCNPGEALIQIQGVAGVICVPACVGFSCNEPVPPSMNNQTVSAQCALESPQGADYCGLICNPNGPNGCPTGATCKYILTTGICTYDV